MDAVLAPWIAAMARHDIRMCLLSATFKGMEGILPPEPDRATMDKMGAYAAQYHPKVSFLYTRDYSTEADVREMGREVLMDQHDVDLILMLDVADELYTADNIDRIIAFVERNPLTCWFRIALRNYIHDTHTYLVEPFTPPRVWRTMYNGYRLARVTYDNDCVYDRLDGSGGAQDKHLPSLTIPVALVSVRHHSWLDDERSRIKIEYQTARWAGNGGAGCSYAWDAAANRLTFNPEYYARTKQALPELAHDD